MCAHIFHCLAGIVGCLSDVFIYSLQHTYRLVLSFFVVLSSIGASCSHTEHLSQIGSDCVVVIAHKTWCDI